jgi:hypothetical protein
MSCCTTKEKESTAELKELEKHFDEVVMEEKDTHYCLTLRDKANKPNYDYIVWLEVMIAYANTNTCNQTSDSKLAGACKSILTWVDLLIKPKKERLMQLSLFGDDEDEPESEPSYPKGDDDNSYAKYYRDLEKVRRNNLMKKYSFFQLFDDSNAWWLYRDMRHHEMKLPQSDKEMIELVKDAITKGTSGDYDGRNDEFWWDDDYDYMTRDGALSDIEIINRVKMLIRLYLVPYQRDFHVYTDMSLSHWECEASTDYHYWFDGKKLNGNSWVNTKHLPEYELYDEDFILWLRAHFNIEHKEAASDEDILKENILGFFRRLTKSDEDLNLELLIHSKEDWREFKSVIATMIPRGNNGSGSGYGVDGFSCDCSIDKKGKITITQKTKTRTLLDRNIDGLEIGGYRDDSVVVFSISGDEIYQEAFRLFGKKAAIQTTIFDFHAA